MPFFRKRISSILTVFAAAVALLFLLKFSPDKDIPNALHSERICFLPEYYKVAPFSGEIVGLPDKSLADVATSVVFDTIPAIVKMSGIPGETISFQLAIPAGLTTRIDAISVISEDEMLQSSLSLFLEIPVEILTESDEKGKWLPDALLPVNLSAPDWKYHFADNQANWNEKEKYKILWFDLCIPPALPAGTHQIKLIINSRQMEKREFSIQLTTLRHNLPPPSVRLDLNEYGPRYLNNKAKATENSRVEKEYFQLAHAHYAALNPLPYKSQRGAPREGFVPEIRLKNGKLLGIDWTNFDRRFGQYFDGTAYSDGVPIDHFYLPFNPDWPASFSLWKDDRVSYEKIWEGTAAAFIKHFRQKNWTRTTFQIYCNQKPAENNQIPWNLDEPKNVDDYRALRYFADLTHRVFADGGDVRFGFRVDISHFFCDEHRGSRQKDFRVNGGDKILEPVDIWVISGHSLTGEYAMQKARDLIGEGKQVWWYGNTPVIPASADSALKIIYQVWQNKLTGLLMWKTVATDLNGKIGKDFIIYRGDLFGKIGPVASIRLKLLRRAIDDTRLLSLLAQKAGVEGFNEMSNRLMKASPEQIGKIRQEIFHRLQQSP